MYDSFFSFKLEAQGLAKRRLDDFHGIEVKIETRWVHLIETWLYI